MRIVIAAILGGLIMFLWGAVSHMVLPVGLMGMKTPNEQKAVLQAIQATAPQGHAVYLYPSLPPEKMMDEAAKSAFSDTHKNSAFAFVVYQPTGNPASFNMKPNLLKQAGSDTAAALVLAIVLSMGGFGFTRSVLVSVLMGVFGWLSISVPYWNWYQFPNAFTLGSLIDETVGWLLAGAVIAGCLNYKKKKKRSYA
jgi:hypothetical protein